MPIEATRIGGIILAAGASTRLGRPKQLLAYKGETLLDRTVSLFTVLPLLDTCLVYGARREDLSPALEKLSFTKVYNPDWGTGMSSSLRSGLQKLLDKNTDLKAVLVALVDQPLISQEHFRQLIDLHIQHPKRIITAAYQETLGVPTIFPKAFFGELLSQKGQAGAKKLIKKYANQVISFSCPEAAFDIDTEEDYQHLLSL